MFLTSFRRILAVRTVFDISIAVVSRPMLPGTDADTGDFEVPESRSSNAARSIDDQAKSAVE